MLKKLLLMLAVVAVPTFAFAETPTESHVIVIVCDGLRPDIITAEDMPTLYKLGQDGTFFAKHHPVYLSSTEVNGTAISTGSYPGHSGVMANTMYRPEIELMKSVAIENQAVVRAGDKVTEGHYLTMPTLAEMLQAKGIRTVVAGTKPVALLLDRRERDNKATSATVFEGHSLPAELKGDEPFPKKAEAKQSANAAQDAWTTQMLTTRLWSEEAGGVPAFTMLWFSEPDFAQHGSGPMSAVARTAMKSSDDNIGRVLADLKSRNLLDSTDVVVVSDHGFSTVSRSIDMKQVLITAGFRAFSEFKSAPVAGDVLVASNGGSVCLYVIGRDPATVQKLTTFLQGQDFAGPIFTRESLPGTFPMTAANIDAPNAPDVLISLKWSSDKSGTGLAGMIVSNGTDRKPGQGNHTTLSPYDMHNTLIACGPHFKKGFRDETASGNVDVAPTILHILNVAPARKLDGRVLTEALVEGGATPAVKTETVTAETKLGDGKIWTQKLETVTVDGTTYINQGSAEISP